MFCESLTLLQIFPLFLSELFHFPPGFEYKNSVLNYLILPYIDTVVLNNLERCIAKFSKNINSNVTLKLLIIKC